MTQRSEGVSETAATVPLPGGGMPVRLFLPRGGQGSGLVLVQEIFGVSRYICSRARDLAALGYVVAVPELYWRLGFAATPEGGPIEEVLDRGMAAAASLGLDQAVADTAAVLQWLPGRAEVTGHVGVIGFCFGGGVAFAAAARLDRPDLPAVLVSYYGSALPALMDRASGVRMPSLHHWGSADSFIPLEAQAQVRAACEAAGGAGVEWFTYEGAGHAFDNPHPAFHHAHSAEVAWERTRDFLRTRLPVVPR